MSEPREHRYSSLGLDLAYVEWGNPIAHTVLLLHGFLDHGRSWDPVAERLSDSFHVVAPDFRGFGKSGWVGAGGSYHFYDYFLDIANLLDLLGTAPVSLVGHSMGANVAAGVAGTLPERVRRVALVEGLGLPDNVPVAAPDRIRRWLEGTARWQAREARPLASVDQAAARLQAQNPRLSSAMAHHLAVHGTRPSPDGGVVWSYDPLHRSPSAKPFYLSEWRAFWGRMPGPVLLVRGGESPFSLPDAQERLLALPSPIVRDVTDAGHNVHHDQPDVLAELLRGFLRGEISEP